MNENKSHTINDFIENNSSIKSFSVNKGGTKVAYVSNCFGENQIFLYSLIEKTTTKINIKNIKDIATVSFSPTEEKLIVGTTKNGDEKIQLSILDVESKELTQLQLESEGSTMRFGGWSSDGTKIAYAINPKNDPDFHIQVCELTTNKITEIISLNTSSFVSGFSPKNSFLTILKNRSSEHTECYLANVITGSVKILPLSGDGNEDTLVVSPNWLSDESGFFYITNRGHDRGVLHFFDINTSTDQFVLELPGELWNIYTSKYDEKIILLCNQDGYMSLYEYNYKKKLLSEKIQFPNGSINSVISISKENYIMSCETAIEASALWKCDGISFERITPATSNIAPDNLTLPTSLHYSSFDGLKIQTFLYTPKNNNEKSPFFIKLHGGPASQYRPTYDPLVQYLVSQGHSVAIPNFRGSTGYGKQFTSLDDKEKRIDALKDIIYLKEFIKENYKNIDTDKTSIFGVSYGGYMVLSLLAFFPEHWKCGISVSGISNFISYLEKIPEWRRGGREKEYGSLSENKELLEKLSPYNSTDTIISPLLLIHGQNDPRVPVSETENMYTKLISNDKKAEILTYKDEGHGIKKRKNQIDMYEKMLDFINNQNK